MAHSDIEVQAPVSERPGTRRDDRAVAIVEVDHLAVREHLSEYLDGALSEGEHERIRDHLEACPACRAFGNTLERVVELTNQLPARRLPDEGKRDLLSRLKAEAATD